MSTLPNRPDSDVAQYLRAFRHDVAPPHAKKRALVALGLSAATVASSGAVAASAVAGAGRLSMLALVKSVAGGAVAGALVLGATSYVERHSASTALGSAARATPDAGTQVGSLSPRPWPAGEALLAADDIAPGPDDHAEVIDPAVSGGGLPLPWAVQRSRVASDVPRPRSPHASSDDMADDRGRPSVAATPSAGPSGLARELSLLDAARAALTRGDVVTTQALLDDYAGQFGDGKLGPEALMLRLELLLLQGDAAGARLLAGGFEQSHPGDSHVRRIHSLLAPHREAGER